MDNSLILISIISAIAILLIIIITSSIKLIKLSKKQKVQANTTNNSDESVYFNLFNSNIELDIAKDVEPDYVKKCVHHLNNLNDSIIDQMCEKLKAFYVQTLEYLEEFDEPEELENIKKQMPQNLSGREILKCVKPGALIIEKPLKNIPAYTIIFYDCIWEEEHGACVIIRGNKILFCADSTGCDIGIWQEEEVYQEELGFIKDYFNDYNLVKKKLKEFNIKS